MTTTQFPAVPPRLKIGAGQAFTFGFFGALGVVTLYVIVSIVLAVIALILIAVGAVSLPAILNR